MSKMIGGSGNGGTMSLLVIAMVTMHSSCWYPAVNSRTAQLVVTNDGPTILGANTTFKATLSNTKAPEYLYSYFWSQTICGKEQIVEMKKNLTCSYTQVYSCPEDIGFHSLKVKVKVKEFIFSQLIAVNTSDFKITEFINANLKITQGMSCNSSYGQDACTTVATNKSVGMAVDIYDPSNYFQGARLKYEWEFGDGFSNTTVDKPWTSHNYSRSGNYGITVYITATFDDTLRLMSAKPTKRGTVNHRLQTMDVIKDLTIQGANDAEVGTKAHYNITCLASLPVTLCWYVIPTSQALQSIDTIPCNRTVLTSNTWLEVHHQFNYTGRYSVGVYAQNAVSSTSAYKNVDSVLPVSQRLTGLVVGILVGIAFCLLCIVVLTSYIKKHSRKHVEVANFDFQKSFRHKPSMSIQIEPRGASQEYTPLSKDFNKNTV